MKFDILTLFPEMISGFLSESILGRAVKNGIIDIQCTNIRDFANDKHNRVDDYPFGGGLGMVMRPQPVFDTYNFVSRNSEHKPYTVYMSPKGKVFNQETAKKMATKEHVVIICGHYEGIDQRVIDEICDEEISIGDYVLTGGEIAACVVCDAVARLVPGVLSESGSFEQESHYNGLLEQPQYTRPRVFNGKTVPEVLLSGNEKNISKWEQEKSIEITMKVRPDLCEKKGIKVITDAAPNTGAKILVAVLGDESAETIKKLENIKMHCDKKELKNVEFITAQNPNDIKAEGFDGVFLVVCSEFFEFELNADVPKVMCGYLSDTAKNADVFEFRLGKGFLVTENVFLSASEIAEEIFDFCISCSYINEINKDSSTLLKCISGRESKKIALKNAIPYDLFENHSKKFEKYQKDDVFFAVTESEEDNCEITMTSLDGDKAFIVQGEIFSLKSKKYGKVCALAAHGLGRFYRHILLNSKINSFEYVRGCYAKRAYKIEVLLNDIKIFCCSKNNCYKMENPFK